mmetsp:Transcript_63075/g.73407  ORF Transcript_63075/g.73407 Transcript_63075/m.73407 type:complete len:269 (+) Transcript_63075:69-875(+)
MEHKGRSTVFSPKETNLGGLITVSTHLYKHKLALMDAKARINSLQKPHPHVDEMEIQASKYVSRPSSAKTSQYHFGSNTSYPDHHSQTIYSIRSVHPSQHQIESREPFHPILTRKNRKLDKFILQKHTNNMRNLKTKIRSIKSGANTTERKKNPFDTGVHPALFFRKPFSNQKPLDYLDIGARPFLGNQRKLIPVTSALQPRTQTRPSTHTSYHSSRYASRLGNGNNLAMDSMDADVFMDGYYRSSQDSMELFENLKRSSNHPNDFQR